MRFSSTFACSCILNTVLRISMMSSGFVPTPPSSPRSDRCSQITRNGLLSKQPFAADQRSESSSTSSVSLSESSLETNFTKSNSESSSNSLTCPRLSDKAFDQAILEEFLRSIGCTNIVNVCIESVASEMAYCNSVYRIGVFDSAKTYYAKLFRPLALSRMTAELGSIDRLVSSHGLVPTPLVVTESAILFDEVRGRILKEADCHGRSNVNDCKAVGRALGMLHSISIPATTVAATENVLWKACESMLRLCHADYSYRGLTLPRLVDIVKAEHAKLESLSLPLVACGHGDCKPCNIFVLHNDEETSGDNVSIRFIDLELAGTHYRAFDLAKFFRTDAPSELYTKANQQAFYQAYLEHYKSATAEQHKTPVAWLRDLQREVKYLLPMTWLEAAIFFVCMACQDQGQANRWNELAYQRFESYQASLSDE
ncbi:hypothetical protein MPSEU_001023100 [Mayamaea pseudoterrestris]|nr:hypothetical protein MPSEU_001023100 [Mayamaea pseudoterrestris]